MKDTFVDIAVIGNGSIGQAIAFELLCRQTGEQVALFGKAEKKQCCNDRCWCDVELFC